MMNIEIENLLKNKKVFTLAELLKIKTIKQNNEKNMLWFCFLYFLL